MISVIIPAYNSQAKIERTLKSVLGQTYGDIEVIVVNDGSTDSTADIVARIAATDKRVRLFNRENAGAYQARLSGIKQARGEWITFSDSDDTLPANALENLISNASDDVDISVGTLNLNNRWLSPNNATGKISANEYIKEILLLQTNVGMCGKLYRKRLFNIPELEQKVRIEQNEDLLMLIKICLNADKVIIDAEKIVYNYHFRMAGQSRKTTKMEGWFQLFEILTSILKRNSYFNRPLLTYKIGILYSEGVLKLNNLKAVWSLVMSVLDEAGKNSLTEDELKKIRIIKSPYKRTLHGILWQAEIRSKNVVKKILGYEQ
ncbi:MAG: glycosyltransferase [Muribaculaceae bacterium]|nr:glycosyltransferase [Muribaculaceae bacterium]